MLAAENRLQSLTRRWQIVSGPRRSDWSAFKDGEGMSHEIIGVAGDVSSINVGKLDGPLFYTAASPEKLSGHSLLLEQTRIRSVHRDLARSLDKDAFVNVEPLEANVRRMLEPARTGAWFSGTVSLLALIIAATGIYGMLSYHVRRTNERNWHSNGTRRTAT